MDCLRDQLVKLPSRFWIALFSAQSLLTALRQDDAERRAEAFLGEKVRINAVLYQ
jgi:hypothetical protein